MTDYASYSTDLQKLAREFMLESAYAQELDRIAYELLIEGSTDVMPIRAPRCSGSAAMVSMASAEVLSSRS